MTKLRYFRCYPDDFLRGTQGMSARLGWAYTRILMGMYAHGGPLEFNRQKLKFLLECRPQDVDRLIQKLCELGKIVLSEDGLLHNGRADEEFEWRANDAGPMALDQGSLPLHMPLHNSKKPNVSTRARARPNKKQIIYISPGGDNARERARPPPSKNRDVNDVLDDYATGRLVFNGLFPNIDAGGEQRDSPGVENAIQFDAVPEDDGS